MNTVSIEKASTLPLQSQSVDAIFAEVKGDISVVYVARFYRLELFLVFI